MVNLLVYSGPEVLPAALKNTLSLLAKILLPNYTIQPISIQVMRSQPWTSNCKLFVFPQCRSGCALPANIAPLINDFVEGGGQVLCLNSAAKVVRGISLHLGGEQEFRFVDRTTGTALYPVFAQDEDGKKQDQTTRRIRSEGLGEIDEGIVEGDMPEFDVQGVRNPSQILAKAAEQDGDRIAAFRCQLGNGSVSFWAPSLENLASDSNDPSESDNGGSRLKLLRNCLSSVGLQIPSPKAIQLSRPLPQFLLSSPHKPALVQTVVQSLGIDSVPVVFRDANDTFQFHGFEEGLSLVHQLRRQQPHEDSDDSNLKHVVICPGGSMPDSEETPLFNLRTYFDHLQTARSREGCRNGPGLGETMLYSQVVTSTQTLLDKNPRFLQAIPPEIPLLSLGSHQLAGRGRGANAWISPAGCLQFSLLLPRVPLTPHSPYSNPSSTLSPSYIPPSKLVFIQYLFALAVVEACRSSSVLGPKLGDSVRIKWPNDIYIYYGGGRAEKVKIGGILVSTTFAPGGKEADIIIGCGLNVTCRHPLFSLWRVGKPTLSSPYSDPVCPPSMEPTMEHLSMELTLAAILAQFENMWDRFLASGGDFEPFLNPYIERWLHSDQLVKLETVSPPKMVRVCGITLDHGLLRTLPERTGYGDEGGYIDLQPDGNSFDLMAGLIKVKS